jgi:probable rRNA maturation factor
MRITVSGDPAIELAPVRRAIRAALRPYGLARDALVGLAFVDDAAMRDLNRRHRRTDRTTDVLSFGQRLPRGARGARAAAALAREPDGTLELGDIVISAAQARRQARRGRRALGREIAFLAAHGALHLLGFEDETLAGYRDMVRLGTKAVERAGEM